MSLPIGSLLNVLAGKTRRDARTDAVQRRRRGPRSSGHTLLATEPLETRSMLALTISLVPGGQLTVTQDNSNPGEQVEVLIGPGTVPGATGPVQATGITINGNTAGGSPISTGTFIPFNDPISGAVNVAGVSLAMVDNASPVLVTDELAAVNSVNGGGSWTVNYGVGGGAIGSSGSTGLISIVSPSRLTVSTKATDVAVNGGFAGGAGSLQVTSASIVLGKTAPVTGTDLTFDTAATGVGKVTLANTVTASNTLSISTNAAFDVSKSITAKVLDLSVAAGATQSGGSVTGSTSFSLAASGGGVSFNLPGNNLATIASIKADGQDIVLNTSATVAQSGAITARSLSLTAGGSVTLDDPLNNLASLAVKAGGNISYTDADTLQVGVAGGTFGLTANGGVSNVTVTTANDLTQTTAGAIQAAQFTAKLLTGAGGGRSITLDSPNNQVGTLVAETTAFGGGSITFVNAANKALTVGDGVNPIASGSDISITTSGSGAGTLTLASPLSTPATITLASGGAITQAPGAGITANTLSVTNNAATGGVVLNAATGGNDVANVSIRNSSTGAAKGISFTGSNAAANGLTVTGTGVAAAGGDVIIDSNLRPLTIASGISTAGGNITLFASNGISQTGGAISGNTLSVTNNTIGAISLDSGLNDVVTVGIKNNLVSGVVSYTDANDLTLSTGPIAGVTAGDSITLNVGGNFSAPAGTGMTAGGAGKITVAAPTGTVSLASVTTAGAGVSITGTGLTATAAITGGGAGSVSLTATTAGVTLSSAVTANQNVTITGPTGVALKTGASATATAGGLTITSAGGGFTAAGGVTLTAGTDVTVTTAATANVGGPVTSGNDFVVKAAGAASDVIIGGAVVAGGTVGLTAGNAVTTAAGIAGNSFSSTSTTSTTLSGAITSATTLNAVAGSTFQNKAALTAGAALAITSTGGLLVNGALQGSTVTLAAGTAASPADITVKSTVTSTVGAVAMTATGGALNTENGAAISSTAAATFQGTAGVAFGDTIKAGGNVAVTTTAGGLNFGAGSGIAAVNKTVTLTSVTGIAQDAASVGIQSNTTIATNSTNGAITLDNVSNNAVRFRATNSAAGGTLDYVDADSLVLALPGTSTNNGTIAIESLGGSITVNGTLSSGTADTTLVAAGNVIQAKTGTITASKLGVDTSAAVGGTVTLNNAANPVNIIYGATRGGAFNFTATGSLQIGIANVVDLVTTKFGDPGANIYVAAGQASAGSLTVAADSLDAGGAIIGLQAKAGISDLPTVTISSGSLALSNTVSGNITLSSPTSGFGVLGANSVGGSTISILDNSPVTLDRVTVSTLSVAGLQAPDGTVILNANGPINQTAAGKVFSSNATFISTGSVDLAAANNNNVANLSVTAVGNVSYTDFDSFAVGVGGAGVVGKLGIIALESKTGSVTLNSTVSTTSSVPWDAIPTTATSIKAAGSITQTAGQVISGDLLLIASSGTISLAQATNDIANLRASAASTVTYVDTNDFEVGFDSDAAPAPGVGTVTVNAGVATFTSVQVPPLVVGDVIVINTLPYRITAIAGPNVTLASGNGVPLTTPATAFGILRAKRVGLDPLTGVAYGVSAGGPLSLTAGPNIVAASPPGLLRVTEGLAWLGSLSLKAGLNSRPVFVEFAVTNTADPSGFAGTLRNMIEYSNANSATQTINGATRVQPMRLVFDELNYPVMDIVPTTALPAIVNPLDINGTLVEQSVTNPRVGINGGAIPTTSVVNGLVYAPGSNDSRITGVAVYGYATGSGIQLRSAVNTVTNSYVGLQRDGTTIAPNKIGIELTGQTATSNTIGTVVVNELAANVIGGNTYAGIVARNGSTGNAIVGNFIGTDAAGSTLGNAGFGISLEEVNGNVIGTRYALRPDGTAAASNVIANNNNSGVRITGARAATANLGNLVENNLIDSNGIDGIQITASAFQTIGGQQRRQANVITRQVGAPSAGGNGVSVTSSSDIAIFANFIGVDEAGSNTLGNARAGVLVDSSTRTVISAGNRIGRNTTGVTVRNGSAATRIEGNYIGTNEFDAALGNTVDGVAIDRSIGNFVRLGNVIANSGVNGVNITDSAAGTLAAGNVVSGNTIRANGTAGVGAGVRIAGGARTTIGGAGVGNVITSNANEGILVEATSFTGSAVGIAMQSNYIGTNKLEVIDPTLGNAVGVRLKTATGATIDGRNVIANSVQEGVRVEGSSGTTVGSTTLGAGNVITRNGTVGVVISDLVAGQSAPVTNQGNNVFGNVISGNALGVRVRGTALPNGSSTTSNVIVGTRSIPGLPLTGLGNTITGNNGVGVVINAAQSVLVQGNSIYGNTGVPIALQNGANAGAVAPTLTSATFAQKSGSTGQVTIQGTFATAGTGTVSVVAGRATFSTPQAMATVGSIVTIGGVGYRVNQVISSVPAGSTVVQLAGTPSTAVAGSGRVASNAGAATFSVPQAPSLVGQSIIVAGRSYVVSSLSADGRTGRLAGNPTFLVSSFTTVQPVSFTLLPANILGQQYVIDIYLNDPADGMPGAGTSGTGYPLRRLLGQAVVTVGPTGPGTFTATVNLPAGVVPAGQYVTATASTMRAATGTSPFSTSAASSVARQLVFAGPGA